VDLESWLNGVESTQRWSSPGHPANHQIKFFGLRLRTSLAGSVLGTLHADFPFRANGDRDCCYQHNQVAQLGVPSWHKEVDRYSPVGLTWRDGMAEPIVQSKTAALVGGDTRAIFTASSRTAVRQNKSDSGFDSRD
jgi:hypothetical protein